MITQKVNLLQRVRVVMIALVAVIGFGTMAMKPAEPLYAHTYGVAETAGGLNWRIVSDVTGQAVGIDYDCNAFPNPPACTVFSDTSLSPGSTLPIDPTKIKQSGIFLNFQ